MHSQTFLSICPMCKTVREIPNIYLHSEVTCTRCFSMFRAEENYVDVEDRHTSDRVTAEETELQCKRLQEGITTKDADRQGFNNFDRPTRFGGQHYVDKPLDWMLVCSKGLQEETSTVGANIEACKDSLRLASIETREHHNEKPAGITSLNKAASIVSSRELGWPNENKMERGNPKPKKRKQTQSSTWGIGLRKPFRERRKVKSYSPSRESGLRKQGRPGAQKGSRVGKHEHITAKKYTGQSRRDKSSNGDVIKGKTTTNQTAGKPSKLDCEGYSEEFKNFMTAEIKRQVLAGLGEASKKMIKEIQVVEVEELLPCTLDTRDPTVSEKQEFMAQVKLITTILFPITLRASDGSPARPPEVPKSREIYEDESKGREVTEGEGKDIKKPEATYMEDPEPQDLKEPEPPTGLMECEKPSDREPLLEKICEVDVPDSEYYDFEFNKSEEKFASQQIWASYNSDLDMMPRDYVQIKKVVSINPFKVYIAVLEPAWLSESGNPLSCGEFSTENRVRIMDKINGFSHLMRWENGKNGMIHIYPGEKEVWALYKDWKEFDQEKRIKRGYDIVQVVAMDEDLTVSVVPLVNHKGSKTVFQKKERELFQIQKKDFDRFSHQVPTYEIIGYDGVEGCVELDPAAIPCQ